MDIEQVGSFTLLAIPCLIIVFAFLVFIVIKCVATYSLALIKLSWRSLKCDCYKFFEDFY